MRAFLLVSTLLLACTHTGLTDQECHTEVWRTVEKGCQLQWTSTEPGGDRPARVREVLTQCYKSGQMSRGLRVLCPGEYGFDPDREQR